MDSLKPSLHAASNLELYTDGGYFSKKDVGGWAAVIFQDGQERLRLADWQHKTSSLEMELKAALHGLQALQKLLEANRGTDSVAATLYTDSRILIEGLYEKFPTWCQNQWTLKSGKPVAYQTLWQQLSELSASTEVKWQWVKGHNGNHGNTLADQLAREAVEQRLKIS